MYLWEGVILNKFDANIRQQFKTANFFVYLLFIYYISMYLVYFITGDIISYHTQCYFSILSFLSRGGIDGISVYTDAPEMYKWFGDQVQVEYLTKDKVRDWRGPQDFIYRVKIKTMEDFCLKHPGQAFIYLDTDTFLYAPSAQLFEGLSAGKGFMHKREGDLAAMKHTAGRVWRQIKGKTFGEFTFNTTADMWNAGLIALPAERQLECVRLGLALSDALCAAGIVTQITEQFSMTRAVDYIYGLSPADTMVGHYWGNKSGWKTLIDDVFLQAYMHKESMDTLIERLRHFDYTQEPVFIAESNTRKRLLALLDKLTLKKDKGVYC